MGKFAQVWQCLITQQEGTAPGPVDQSFQSALDAPSASPPAAGAPRAAHVSLGTPVLTSLGEGLAQSAESGHGLHLPSLLWLVLAITQSPRV